MSEMPFLFFRLPSEIRNMIYELLFLTPRRDKTLAPDPERVQAVDEHDWPVDGMGDRLKPRKINIHHSLPFLYTCQQVHGEATEVLYGGHIFWFDDTPHGDWTLTMEWLTGSHKATIPQCDLLFMMGWLKAIGEKNRLKIRRIQLRFSRDQSVRSITEGLFHEADGDQLHVTGGDLVAGALHLLSQGHNLQTLSIAFQKGLQDDNLAFKYFFRPNGLLREFLSRIKGIKQLEWADDVEEVSSDPEHTKVVQNARAKLRELKEDMELGHTERKHVECSVPFTKKAVDQVNRAIRYHDSVSEPSTLNLPCRLPGSSPYSYSTKLKIGLSARRH